MRSPLLHPRLRLRGCCDRKSPATPWVACIAGCLKVAGFTDVHFLDAMTLHLDRAQARARFQELGDEVEVFDFGKCNFVTPLLKPTPSSAATCAVAGRRS